MVSFVLRPLSPQTLLVRRLGGPERAGLEVVAKKYLPDCWESNPDRLVTLLSCYYLDVMQQLIVA